MDITIHTSVLPHVDPDASVAFYRDILGFEVRNDVGRGQLRWITVGPAGQPGTSTLLATKNLDATFENVQAGDAEVVQEPTEQPYGIRDCAFRDPAGNMVRIQELR
ncbi:VOC family protein [Streptomyces sp. NPDC005970]|uniref:VOC family protein n=1 Tax=Streptomyces sp. NPDC005970 TaxID=3156723 RepID=UPI0033F8CA75